MKVRMARARRDKKSLSKATYSSRGGELRGGIKQEQKNEGKGKTKMEKGLPINAKADERQVGGERICGADF